MDVIGGLTLCRGAVVTTCTITGHIGMVKCSGRPGIGRMTVVAVVATCYMAGMFARRDTAVVTARTDPENLQVIDPNDR